MKLENNNIEKQSKLFFELARFLYNDAKLFHSNFMKIVMVCSNFVLSGLIIMFAVQYKNLNGISDLFGGSFLFLMFVFLLLYSTFSMVFTAKMMNIKQII